MTAPWAFGTYGEIILDTGGVFAYLGRERTIRDLCENTLAAGYSVVLPTVVYAQVERGGRQRPFRQQLLSNLLGFCTVAPLTLEIAQQAGWLLGDSATTDVVDAVVVVEALNRDGALILTSDRGDIQYLLTFGSNRLRRRVRVIPT